jgi:hypothetical protein
VLACGTRSHFGYVGVGSWSMLNRRLETEEKC